MLKHCAKNIIKAVSLLQKDQSSLHAPKPLGDITEAMSSFYIQSVVWSHVVGVLEVLCVSRDVDIQAVVLKRKCRQQISSYW